MTFVSQKHLSLEVCMLQFFYAYVQRCVHFLLTTVHIYACRYLVQLYYLFSLESLRPVWLTAGHLCLLC